MPPMQTKGLVPASCPCYIFRVDCAIRKDYYAVNYANYAIFPSTILSLFSQDSEKVNHFYAALATIFS